MPQALKCAQSIFGFSFPTYLLDNPVPAFSKR
jgi:hypothetical protein